MTKKRKVPRDVIVDCYQHEAAGFPTSVIATKPVVTREPKGPFESPGLDVIDKALCGVLKRPSVTLIKGERGVGKTTFLNPLFDWPTIEIIKKPRNKAELAAVFTQRHEPVYIVDGIEKLGTREQSWLIEHLYESKATAFIVANTSQSDHTMLSHQVSAVITIERVNGDSVRRIRTSKHRFARSFSSRDEEGFLALLTPDGFKIVTSPNWNTMSTDAILRALSPALSATKTLDKQLAAVLLERSSMSEVEKTRAGVSLLRAATAMLPKHVTTL